MEKAEVAECLKLLKVAYPNYYKDMSRQDAEALVQLWAVSFSDYDASTVRYALIALLNSSKFCPNIAEVKEYIQRMEDISCGVPSDGELWSILRRAVSNGYYNYREEFEKLPEVLKSYVGAAEQLKMWSQIDEAVFNSVHQSNFMKNIKIAKQRTTDSKNLPPQVRQMLLDRKRRMEMPVVPLIDENERRNQILNALEN